MDKYIEVLKRWEDSWSDGFGGGECIYSHNFEDVAKELHAMRYEVARVVLN